MLIKRYLAIIVAFPLLVAAGSKVVLHPVSCHGRPKPFKPGHRGPVYEPGSHGGHDGDGHNGTSLTDVDFELRGDEQLLWGSPNDITVAIASVKITPFPGQKIIDMERFADGIAEATCSETMVFRFSQRAAFATAQRQWNWVNQGPNRAFVLVGDPGRCKSGISRDPWLVSHIAFDFASFVIRLDAVKKLWSEVTYEYDIDFGAAATRSIPKRALLDYAYERAYEVPLATSLPTDLFSFHAGDLNAVNMEFDVKCRQCGISGKLVFSGRIAGNYLTGVQQLDLSLIPIGVQADLNLEFLFAGTYKLGMYGLPDVKAVLEVYDVSLLNLLPAGWLISGIVDLGPGIKVQAGVELDSLEGRAQLGAGLSALVPADSVARLALRSEDVVQVNGWIPDVQVKPITLAAQVSAIVKFYAQVVPSFDFVLFGQHGFRGGLPFKFPKLELNITTGTDHNGFCPNDPNPTGIKVEASLGAELSAVVVERMAPGVSQVSGMAKENIRLFEPAVKEQIYLDKELLKLPLASRSLQPRVSLVKGEITIAEGKVFDEPIRRFDPWCRSLPGEPCLFVPEPDDKAWFDIEIDSADTDLATQPPLTPRRLLFPRRESPKFVCEGETVPYVSKPYPGPQTVKAANHAGGDKVPIMLPLISCDAKACPVADWTIVRGDASNVVIPADQPKKTIWSMEHVYELNWLSRFWAYLNKPEGVPCPELIDSVLRLRTGGGAERMQLAIGNTNTYLETMTLLPKRENALKHRMFARKQLHAKFKDRRTTIDQRACSIGRIVSVCKMMDGAETQTQLNNTLSNLDKVLTSMQTLVKLKDKNYLLAHQEWFTKLYNDGISFTRETLADFARFMVDDSTDAGLEGLGENTKKAIRSIADAKTEAQWKAFCPNNFKYPGYTPTTGTSCGDTQSNPKNCGECSVVCPDNQICSKGTCTDPPPPANPNGVFQPPVLRPIEGLSTQWSIFFPDPPFLNTDSYILEEDRLLKYDGKLTLNTRCIGVTEFTSKLPGATYLDSQAHFEWSRGEDSCCLVVFRDQGCKASGQRFEFCASGTDYIMPFDAYSVMVYGCRGLKVEG